MLEKATQNRPEARYQTVEEFWDDIADASLPPTRPLQMVPAELQLVRRKPSEDLSVEPEEEFTEAAPPRPHFDVPDQRVSRVDRHAQAAAHRGADQSGSAAANARARSSCSRERSESARRVRPPVESVLPASRKRRALVALGLILAFSGMLLATHKYVTTRWNPLAPIPQTVEPVVIGREGVTTTDVNLRPVANAANVPIGLAESGSKVKVLSADSNWYEVQVVEHGRPKIDPYSSDRGWINKTICKV